LFGIIGIIVVPVLITMVYNIIIGGQLWWLLSFWQPAIVWISFMYCVYYWYGE